MKRLHTFKNMIEEGIVVDLEKIELLWECRSLSGESLGSSEIRMNSGVILSLSTPFEDVARIWSEYMGE